jgi:hypothetical protein
MKTIISREILLSILASLIIAGIISNWLSNFTLTTINRSLTSLLSLICLFFAYRRRDTTITGDKRVAEKGIRVAFIGVLIVNISYIVFHDLSYQLLSRSDPITMRFDLGFGMIATAILIAIGSLLISIGGFFITSIDLKFKRSKNLTCFFYLFQIAAVALQSTGTINDLTGKQVECIMISRFSDSGLVPFANPSGFKTKKQKVTAGMMRYQFFITTGSFTSGIGPNNKLSYLSVGAKVNTENYPNVTGNNQNYIMRHSGISGENLFGTINLSNSGNYRFNYQVTSLDPKIIIDPICPTGFSIRGGDIYRSPARKHLFRKRNISYSINTSGLSLNQNYTGYVRVSGIYRNDAIYNITGVNVPITYRISNHGARAAFDNFYFRYTGDFHNNINGFQVYPTGNTISWSSGISGYPKLTLGLSIYNTGTGVYSSNTLDRISSGFYKPKMESNLFWKATGDSNNIRVLNSNGSVHFATGISGSLPAGKYIIHSGQSGAYQNDIFFCIHNTGQIGVGIFSGNLLVNVSDSSGANKSFPISVNFL